MPVKFQKWITRKDLRKNPEFLYLFGDNDQRKGRGGQAKEMRGEPNAVGVRTKYAPSMAEKSFFHDRDEGTTTKQVDMIAEDTLKPYHYLLEGGTVVIPSDGLGSGLAQLRKRAPTTYAVLNNVINYWCDEFGVFNED